MLEMTQFDISSLHPHSYTNVGQITCTRIWFFFNCLVSICFSNAEWSVCAVTDIRCGMKHGSVQYEVTRD